MKGPRKRKSLKSMNTVIIVMEGTVEARGKSGGTKNALRHAFAALEKAKKEADTAQKAAQGEREEMRAEAKKAEQATEKMDEKLKKLQDKVKRLTQKTKSAARGMTLTHSDGTTSRLHNVRNVFRS